MIKLDDYKSEILSLLNQGKSTDLVAKELSGRYGIEFNGRSIRSARERWASEGSEVGSILSAKGLDPSNWAHAWVKSKEGTVFIKNTDGLITHEDFRDDLLESLKSYSPSFDKIKREKISDPHCLVIDIADLHIGKLASALETGEEYNVGKAVELASQGVAGILQKAEGFKIDQIVFVIGNDVLHVDNPAGTTTSGTKQDTDGTWYDNFMAAKDLYINVIEKLVQEANVHIVHNPSNHDYMTGFMLADTVYSWFRKHPNITFDVSMSHRKYYAYGENLIATSHGDGAKMADMPLLMANESGEAWAKTKHRYIYLHHIHHMRKINFLSGQDYHGATVEYLRSVSYTDSWHHRKGYQHVPKCVTGFVHHKEFGQVARLTHLFK